MACRSACRTVGRQNSLSTPCVNSSISWTSLSAGLDEIAFLVLSWAPSFHLGWCSWTKKLLPLGDLEPPRVLWEQLPERCRIEVIEIYAKLIKRTVRAISSERRKERHHEATSG